MTLSARTFAHINFAGFEVELGRYFGVTGGEQAAFDGGAVLVRLDAALPVVFTRGRTSGHVTWQHGARLPTSDTPRVAKLLTGAEQVTVSSDEIVPLVSVEVPAKPAHVSPHLGRNRQLEETDPVPQQSGSCNNENKIKLFTVGRAVRI